MQPPFFDPDADDAVDYGGIGAVIGHEIGHGFDDQGAKYDGDGNLKDWWTDDDRTEFGGAPADRAVRRLHAPRPRERPPRQRRVTLGENIGDLGGLTIACGLPAVAERRDRSGIDGLTGAQRFFFGWAQVWRTKSVRRGDPAAGHRPALPAGVPLQRRHPHIDAFYDAFNAAETTRYTWTRSTGSHLELGPIAEIV